MRSINSFGIIFIIIIWIINGLGNIFNDFHMNYQWVLHVLYDLSNQRSFGVPGGVGSRRE